MEVEEGVAAVVALSSATAVGVVIVEAVEEEDISRSSVVIVGQVEEDTGGALMGCPRRVKMLTLPRTR